MPPPMPNALKAGEGGSMKVTIETGPNEKATLVVETQERPVEQVSIKTPNCNANDLIMEDNCRRHIAACLAAKNCHVF